MRIPIPPDIPRAEDLGPVHFVGIGGAALSGLARIMHARGISVTGSDARDSTLLASLRALGITCYVGHAAEQVGDAATVVISTAIRADNPELVRALGAGLRVWPRAAAVQSLLLGSRSVVVTGTHGKTTTTSMLATALLACGADPSYAIGSTLNTSGLNAAQGGGDIFVVEGDESDGAILAYTPSGAVLTNVDADHLDVYGTPEAYARVFEEFLDRIDPDGFLVACVDDPGAAQVAGLAAARGLRVVGVGLVEKADLRVTSASYQGETSEFTVARDGVELGRVALQVPGLTYVVDAALAVAAGLELGFAFDALAAGLGEFRGSGRRMELRGSVAGIRVYDSYAHHPAEIRADLGAARGVAGGGRLVVCFQPHLFSRTRVFGARMGQELGEADEVVVMDVYPAREEPDPEITGATVATAVPLPAERVRFVRDSSEVPGELVRRTRPGDVIVTMGAGDVTDIGPLVLAELASRQRGGMP
jgi:UDP-N-acetylmuramate--alanine ligase